MLNMINSLSNANSNNHWSWSFLTWNSKTALGEVTQRFRQPEVFQNCNFPLTRLAFGVTEFGFQVNHEFSHQMQVINHVPGIQRQVVNKYKIGFKEKDFRIHIKSYSRKNYQLNHFIFSVVRVVVMVRWGCVCQSIEFFWSNDRF